MRKKIIYKILLIDDDPDIINILSEHLRKDEFNLYTTTYGYDGIEIAKEHLPEIVIVNLELPDTDGIEVCKTMREVSGMKYSIISFLTERNEGFAQISAFNAGADDFIVKPISQRLLLIKIKVYINKYKKSSGLEQKGSDVTIIETKEFSIHPEKYAILKNDIQYSLPKKEFELLLLLAQNKNKVVSREEIYNKLWGEKSNVSERAIDVYIKKLRDKINNKQIVTVKKCGFKFIDK